MSNRTYRKRVRVLAGDFLRLFGLHHWRLTRLYVGFPKHVKKDLVAHYPEAQNGFYACVYPTGRNTFVMAVSRDIPEDRLENVIAHEISHILLNNLHEATTNGQHALAKNQLEVVCDRIANAVTRR